MMTNCMYPHLKGPQYLWFSGGLKLNFYSGVEIPLFVILFAGGICRFLEVGPENPLFSDEVEVHFYAEKQVRHNEDGDVVEFLCNRDRERRRKIRQFLRRHAFQTLIHSESPHLYYAVPAKSHATRTPCGGAAISLHDSAGNIILLA